MKLCNDIIDKNPDHTISKEDGKISKEFLNKADSISKLIDFEKKNYVPIEKLSMIHKFRAKML